MTDEERNIINQEIGNVDEISTQASEIIEAAKSEADPVILQDGDDQNVAEKFKGLPMRELIAAPLIAAAESQQKLAETALDFYDKIAFETTKGEGDESATKTTRLIEFSIQKPVEQDGVLTLVDQTVKAPFIGLVPIPSLLIDRVDIDFQMEVTDTNVSKSSKEAEADAKITAKSWCVSAEISGKVSTSRENTRTTNQTAKYQVHVTASQQPQTEGLSKLMDIMASCIEPITVSDSK